MDAGVLTDNLGRKADFRNTILIMTTNIGAELLSKKKYGFNEQSVTSDAMETLNRLFTNLEIADEIINLIHYQKK